MDRSAYEARTPESLRTPRPRDDADEPASDPEIRTGAYQAALHYGAMDLYRDRFEP